MEASNRSLAVKFRHVTLASIMIRFALHRVAFLMLTVASLAPGTTTAQDSIPAHKAEIPFEFENNRIRLTMELQGTAITMLLDSGASTSILFGHDHDLITSLKAVGKTAILFPALDERIEGDTIENVELLLAGEPILLEKMVRLDSKSDLRARLLLRYDGILGQEFFQQFAIEIDPAARVLRLYDRGSDLSALYRTTHTLYMQDDAPHIRFRSKMPWETMPSTKEMLVDTGYPGAIVFWDSTHYRKAAKLTPEAYRDSAAIVGRASFSFGRLKFLGTPVYLGAYPPKQVGKRDGLIGASILNNFSYAIDLTSRKMWMLSIAEGSNYSRQIDGTFYPPNDDDYVFSAFTPRLSIAPTTVVRQN